MRTFEHTTSFTAHTDRGQLVPVSLPDRGTYAWALWTLGVYLYLCLDCGWWQVR